MASTLDDGADAESMTRGLLDLTLADAAERPLPELLGTVAEAALRAARASAAVVRTLGVASGREHVAQAGDPSAAADLATASAPNGVLADVLSEGMTAQVGQDGGPGGPQLLGVPILVRGQPAGAVTVAVEAALDDADVRAVEELARTAGTFIERARTAEANQRRERWYAAGATLAKELVAGLHPDGLHEIAARVLYLADADGVAIIQHGAAEDTFVIAAAAGLHADQWSGQVYIAQESVTAQVMTSGRAARVPDMAALDLPDELRKLVRTEGAVLVPLLGSGVQRGVLTITRLADRPPIGEAEIGMATMFASTVALALELAESQRRRDQRALVEERDRIARDLHDHVIQRLYAIGLSLQNVSSKLSDDDMLRRLGTSVDGLDETIKEIRRTIFQLTRPIVASDVSFRVRAESLVADLTPVLGFAPRLVSHGAMEFGVAEDVVDDCVAVLREALTNIARHAQATQAEVAISVSASTVRVEVRDNGRGLGEASRRSGLANLRARAERRGGFMQVRSTPGDGTWLLWSIPVEGPGKAVAAG